MSLLEYDGTEARLLLHAIKLKIVSIPSTNHVVLNNLSYDDRLLVTIWCSTNSIDDVIITYEFEHREIDYLTRSSITQYKFKPYLGFIFINDVLAMQFKLVFNDFIAIMADHETLWGITESIP